MSDPYVTTAAVSEVDGRLVVTWPSGRGRCLASPEVVEGWAGTVNDLRDEVERLRGLLAEILPYADAGADALAHWEPYGSARGEAWEILAESADAMLERLRSTEFQREAGLA